MVRHAALPRRDACRAARARRARRAGRRARSSSRWPRRSRPCTAPACATRTSSPRTCSWRTSIPRSASCGGAKVTRQTPILPVLLDLGVAAKDAELVLAGTPAYFAPEVAARFSRVPDPPPVGPKADVFSLALTLRHALDPRRAPSTWRRAPSTRSSPSAPRTRPSRAARRDLRDLRPYFERWLHVSPDERPSAEELRRERRVLTRPEERAARRWRVMRWALPTALAVLALFAAVVYVLSREASLQRLEAEQARERAAQAGQRAESIYASLTSRARAARARGRRRAARGAVPEQPHDARAARVALGASRGRARDVRRARRPADRASTEAHRDRARHARGKPGVRQEIETQSARAASCLPSCSASAAVRGGRGRSAAEQQPALPRRAHGPGRAEQRLDRAGSARSRRCVGPWRVLPAAAARASQLELLRSETGTSSPLSEAP